MQKLAGFNVPNSSVSVTPCSHDFGSVGAESNIEGRSGAWKIECLADCAGSKVPDSQTSILRRRYYPVASRREDRLVDRSNRRRIAGDGEIRGRGAGVCIPYLDGPVAHRGDNSLIVGAEAGAMNRLSVGIQYRDAEPGSDVPDACCAVFRRCHDALIVMAKCDGEHPAGMTFEFLLQFAVE